MAQDTRKDPRAKVLSMTVRYKSATIDEFIEHHSHDVSRGGIYIKTPSPFPPGTLLKFEIRIQEEQSVLAGVGRVVWKREPAQSAAEMPAGMGVKFIKIDDKSKALISRLVESQEGKVSNFDAGKPEAPSAPPAAANAPTPVVPMAAAAAASVPAATPSRPGTGTTGPNVAAKRASTMLGLGAIGSAKAEAPRPEAAAAAGAVPSPRQVAGKASTLLGVQAPDVQSAETGGGFFPKTNPQAEMPPAEERTVMKQAAELLQQALAEAGGSMEEVGTAAKETPAHESKPEAARGSNGEALRGASDRPAAAKTEEAPARREATTVNERQIKPEPKPVVSAAKPAEPAPVRAPVVAEPDREEGGASGKILTMLLIAAALAVGGYVYLNRPGPGSTPESGLPTQAPLPSAAPTTAQTAAPTATTEVVPVASSTASVAAATASAAPSAAPSATAKVAPPTPPKTVAVSPPKPPTPPTPPSTAAVTPPKPPPAAPVKKGGGDPYD